MKYVILSFHIFISCSAFSKTWAEKLGFPKNKRVLIIHADDAGMMNEANIAIRRNLENGAVSSASAMPPTPAFANWVAWAKTRPDLDTGLHLTLNSEWKRYRWPTVAPVEFVPSLIDPEGYIWKEVFETASKADPQEVEIELRAQIEKALSYGYRPTHMDSHMGTIFANPAFTQIYLDLADEYDIPVMAFDLNDRINKFLGLKGKKKSEMKKVLSKYKLPKVDFFAYVLEADSYEMKKLKMFALLKSLPKGITQFIFHPSEHSQDLEKVTGSWQQRVWEAQIWEDQSVKDFLKKEGFIVTNWIEIMNRHRP